MTIMEIPYELKKYQVSNIGRLMTVTPESFENINNERNSVLKHGHMMEISTFK